MSLNGNVTLDLNGHVLRMTGDNRVISVGNHTLDIYDSNPTATHSPAITYTDSITKQPHTVLGGVITGGVTDLYGGGGIYVNQGTLNLHAGSICGNSTTGYGGGVYINRGTFNMSGGTICGNKATKTNTAYSSDAGSGGGVYIIYGTFNMTGGSITGNVAEGNHNVERDEGGKGGGIYFVSSSATITGSADISYNLAVNRTPSSHNNSHNGSGGGICTAGTGSLTIKKASIHHNKTYSEGGGLMLQGSYNVTLGGDSDEETCSITHNQGGFERNGGGGIGVQLASKENNLILNHCLIAENTANARGGGIYISSGNIVMNEGAIIEYNLCYSQYVSGGSGGGIYVSGSSVEGIKTVSGQFHGGEIRLNKVTRNDFTTIAGSGGGAEVHSMDFELNGTSIHDNRGSSGGGLYLSATALTFVDGTIANNYASSNGGGLYIASNSTCTMTGGNIMENTAGYGGGVYVSATTFNMNGGNIKNNKASSGGGVYNTSNSTMTMTGDSISSNTASSYGGGVYNSSNSTMTMTGGSISSNTASSYGGGVYNSSESTMTMSGGEISSNTVIFFGGGVYNSATLTVSGGSISGNTNTNPNGKGAGIYQNGAFFVSANPVFNAADDVYLTARHYITKDGVINVSSPIHATVADIKRGRDVVISKDEATDAASGQVVNGDLGYFVVNGANRRTCNLLYTADGRGDDVLGTVRATPSDVLELEITWVQAVTKKPNTWEEDDEGIILSCEEDLAWLISVVNGYNKQTAQNLSNKTVKLTADVDMSEYPWVAIGTAEHPFKGTFDAQGHSITGLYNLFDDNPVLDLGVPGLFGVVDGGTVKNTFVIGSDFHAYTNPVSYVGIIADTLINSAVLHSSESAGQLTAMAGSIVAMGGIAGLVDNASVHSSMSMATLNGYNMGGAVGEIRNGSSLKNSFTHALYTSTNDAAGLAYMNAGAIDNCYVRVRSGNTLANMFVTEGTGTVSNVYYPEGQTSSTGAAYTTTVTPYYYKHADNRVGSTPLLQLLNTNRGTGAEWMRTSAGTGNSRGTNSSINDDYPVLKLNDFNSLASSDGIVLRYGDINDMLASFTASTDAIDLYRSKAGVNSNSSSAANLYINEDVALTSEGTVNAYVGITLDNSAGANGANPNGLMGEGLTDAIDWHMFSSPLTNAPLGINYTDNEQHAFSWNESSTPHYSFYPESTQNGYFPSKTFGTNGSDGTDYYTEWDFYCFYEPDYHWINFKRNSNSHWHEDVPYYGDPSNPADHAQIIYSNESTLTPGKGYLLASKEETFLQAYGNLNSGDISIDVTRQGAHLKGYNLLGNPYQSYLDFDAFAEENASLWETNGTRYSNSYILLDEDQKGYVSYTPGTSKGANAAPRYINMHQGFMILADNAGTASFTNGMRSIGQTPDFRGEGQPAYPLVNLRVADANGNCENLVVEMNRPDCGGARKAKGLRMGKGQFYAHHEDGDYAIFFAREGMRQVPLYFETDVDDTFVLTWDTQNGQFYDLRLVDNITGANVDMSQNGQYVFQSSATDYKSRFKLVFDVTGLEEDEDGMASDSFAFVNNGLLVVNAEGQMDIVDLNGRVVYSSTLTSQQSVIDLNHLSHGLYVLKIAGQKSLMTQKIVF